MVLGEYLRAARGAQPTVRRQAAGTSCKQQKGSQKSTNIDPPGRTRFLDGFRRVLWNTICCVHFLQWFQDFFTLFKELSEVLMHTSVRAAYPSDGTTSLS